MSACFIIEYAGGPVRFNDDVTIEIVTDHLASPFTSDGDAIMAAHRAGLNIARCTTVNLYLRDLVIGRSNRN